MTPPNDALLRELRYTHDILVDLVMPLRAKSVAAAIAALEQGPDSSQADTAHHAVARGTGVGPESLPPVDQPPTAEDAAAAREFGAYTCPDGTVFGREQMDTVRQFTVDALKRLETNSGILEVAGILTEEGAKLCAASRRQWRPDRDALANMIRSWRSPEYGRLPPGIAGCLADAILAHLAREHGL